MAEPLKFEWDPLDAPGVTDAADAATWASLTITVDAEQNGPVCLTSALDSRSKTIRRSLYGNLLPLAEWFVRSWSHLFRSRRVPAGAQPQSRDLYRWERTHCLRFVGDGMALPDLTFIPDDAGTMRLVWNADPDPDLSEFSSIQFLGEGDVRVHVADVEQSCASFIDSVIRRLFAIAPQHPLTLDLSQRWEVVTNPQSADHLPEMLSAFAGDLWDELDQQKRSRLQRLAEEGIDVVTACLLHLSNEADLEEWENRSRRIWQHCVSSAKPVSPGWGDLRGRIHSVPSRIASGDPPWAMGWEAARRYRRAMGLDEDARPQVQTDSEGFETDQMDLPLPSNETLIAWHAGRTPLRARGNLAGQSPRRATFLDARDLYPLLFESDPGKDFATVVSYRVAGVTSIANAFAAELLAPVTLLKSKLSSVSAIDTNGIGDLASEIDAPFGCVLHQIDNHGLAIIADRPCPSGRRTR